MIATVFDDPTSKSSPTPSPAPPIADCHANDRDDLEEEEDQEESKFRKKMEIDLNKLIDEIRTQANVKTQNPSKEPVLKEAENKEVSV